MVAGVRVGRGGGRIALSMWLEFVAFFVGRFFGRESRRGVSFLDIDL